MLCRVNLKLQMQCFGLVAGVSNSLMLRGRCLHSLYYECLIGHNGGVGNVEKQCGVFNKLNCILWQHFDHDQILSSEDMSCITVHSLSWMTGLVSCWWTLILHCLFCTQPVMYDSFFTEIYIKNWIGTVNASCTCKWHLSVAGCHLISYWPQYITRGIGFIVDIKLPNLLHYRHLWLLINS
jgi:hypothetical protein